MTRQLLTRGKKGQCIVTVGDKYKSEKSRIVCGESNHKSYAVKIYKTVHNVNNSIMAGQNYYIFNTQIISVVSPGPSLAQSTISLAVLIVKRSILARSTLFTVQIGKSG